MLGWTLLALVLLIFATFAGAFGVLQTGWGKREIASLASGALSGEGKTAEIAGIEGFLPFDMRVDRVRLGIRRAIGWRSMPPASTSCPRPSCAWLEIATVGAERVGASLDALKKM